MAVKKDKDLRYCRTRCFGFIQYKWSKGYPNLNVWINDREKDYLVKKVRQQLKGRSLKIEKEEREKNSDWKILLNKINELSNNNE